MSVDGAGLQEGLTSLRERFVGRLRDDADLLALVADRLRLDDGDGADLSADRDTLRHVAHRLAGAAGIFGYERLTRPAAELDNLAETEASAAVLAERAAALAAKIRLATR